MTFVQETFVKETFVKEAFVRKICPGGILISQYELSSQKENKKIKSTLFNQNIQTRKKERVVVKPCKTRPTVASSS